MAMFSSVFRLCVCPSKKRCFINTAKYRSAITQATLRDSSFAVIDEISIGSPVVILTEEQNTDGVGKTVKEWGAKKMLKNIL